MMVAPNACYFFNPIATFHPPKFKQSAKIILDYLRFTFNSTHKTIAWNFENNQTCKPPVTFAIQSLGCDEINTWNTLNLEYSLPVNEILNEEDKTLYLIIIAYNTTLGECVRTTPFQLHQNCKQYMPYSLHLMSHIEKKNRVAWGRG